MIADEAGRVADIAYNAGNIINDIERQFEETTKLTKSDIILLFLATAMQCCRQYLLTKFEVRPDHDKAAKNTFLEKLVDPKDKKKRIEAGLEVRHHKLYQPSFNEVWLHPVPFDTIKGSKDFGNPFSGAGKLGHRAAAIGHDILFGLVLGTCNIATSTITNNKFQSFHVSSKTGIGGGDFLKSHASTIKVLEYTGDKIINNTPNNEGRKIVALSLLKEIAHLRSDLPSKNSLPLPIISVIDAQTASKLAEYGFDMENIEIVGKQAAMACAINQLFSLFHSLYYDETKDGPREMYQVRTRKILAYSNLMASLINISYVSFSSALGNKDTIRKLDIGGFLVTIGRLICDYNFITNIKKEFLENEFYKQVQGNTNLKEAYKMSVKDYKKGMIAGAKPFGEKFSELQTALKSADEKQINNLNNTVSSLIEGVSELDAYKKYQVDFLLSIDDLGATDKKAFFDLFYKLTEEFPEKNRYQKEFIANVLTWLGNGLIPTGKMEFNTIKFIDSISKQELLLRLFYIYFSLSGEKITDKETEILDYFAINKDKDISTINDFLDKYGLEFLVNLYKKDNLNSVENFLQTAKVCFYEKKYDSCIKWLNFIDDNSDALYLLGECYENGLNDIESAECYYQKAAEKNDIRAQLWLGNYYSNNSPEKNDELAVKWYIKAANQDNAIAQYAVGIFYYEGRGVPKNYEEALTWLNKASLNGEIMAFYYIGLIYEDKDFKDYNVSKAVDCYLKTKDTEIFIESKKRLRSLYADCGDELQKRIKEENIDLGRNKLKTNHCPKNPVLDVISTVLDFFSD